MKKSEANTITVSSRSSKKGFEKAINLARMAVIRLHGIEKFGNCKDSKTFQEFLVEFVGMRFTLNMIGGTHEYEFETWMNVLKMKFRTFKYIKSFKLCF